MHYAELTDKIKSTKRRQAIRLRCDRQEFLCLFVRQHASGMLEFTTADGPLFASISQIDEVEFC